MNATHLQLREQLSLSIRHQEGRIRFRTQVADVGVDFFAVNLLDLPEARQGALVAGDEVRGTIVRHDALYHFSSYVIGVFPVERLQLLRVAQPRNFWREQRRQFFRVEHRIPVVIQLEYQNSGAERQSCTINGSILNISAGGVKILADLPDGVELQQGAHVMLSFDIEEFSFTDLLGEVLRIDKSPTQRSFAVIFIDPKIDTQNTITRLNILYERRFILGG